VIEHYFATMRAFRSLQGQGVEFQCSTDVAGDPDALAFGWVDWKHNPPARAAFELWPDSDGLSEDPQTAGALDAVRLKASSAAKLQSLGVATAGRSRAAVVRDLHAKLGGFTLK